MAGGDAMAARHSAARRETNLKEKKTTSLSPAWVRFPAAHTRLVAVVQGASA